MEKRSTEGGVIMNKDTLSRLREQYPVGTRIVLLKMDDSQAPPVGAKGTVAGVDDIGNIMVRWDNGSGLNLVPKVDEYRIVSTMPPAVKEQILAVRDTGLTNMFDMTAVQRIAYDMNFYDLICWLEDHKKEYSRFIMFGE